MHGTNISEDEPMSEMNMVPLIDIALTLVIILMVTTAFVRNPGVSLKLPQSATREGTPETKKDITVIVESNGRVSVDGQVANPEQLLAQFKKVAKQDLESRVLIKGDKDVSYNKIMQVMDTARQAGLTKVVLPTEPLKEGGSAKS